MKHTVKFITLSLILSLALFGAFAGCSSDTQISGGGGGGGTAASIRVTLSPSAIAASGVTTVSATVMDLSNQPVPNVTVTFTLSNGTAGALSATTATTNAVGVAAVQFTAAAGVNAAVVVTAVAPAGSTTVSNSAFLTIGSIGGGGGGSGTPTAISVTADSSSLVTSASTFVRVLVTDVLTNPVSNVTVNFTILASSTATGTFTPASGSAVTDSNGRAYVQFMAGASAGSVVIQAAVSATVTNTTTITVTGVSAVPAASIIASASPIDIDVGGQSLISAVVRDISGNPLSGRVVNLTITSGGTLGSLAAASATTDINGYVSVVFTALTNPGTVTIQASPAASPALVANATVRITSLPASITATVAAPSNTISTKSSTNITAYVTNQFGNPVSDGTIVTFTSANLLGGSLTASASTAGGYATATYLAGTQSGAVTVTMSATTGTATPYNVVITVQPSAVGSIEFDSATPQIIGVKSSGQAVTSVVQFQVLDTTNQPVNDGVQVRFDLTGPNGGEYIGDPDATPRRDVRSTTGGTGAVWTVLNSGTVAGPVRITATVLDALGNPTTVTTAFAGVSIGGGIPSARHFSITTSKYNIAGLFRDDRQTTINVFVADRFGNYNVMPATTVSFYTEAGAIGAASSTNTVGATSVMLRSQAPTPVDVAPAAWETAYSYSALVTGFTQTVTFNPRDGWVRVIAVTRGEEKFVDLNANGLYDSGEPVDDLGEPYVDANNDGFYSNVTETIFTDSNGNGKYDRGEPFTDTNANGVRDEAEYYIDTNGDGNYDGPNGTWDIDTNIWVALDVVFTNQPKITFSTVSSGATSTHYNISALPYEPFTDWAPYDGVWTAATVSVPDEPYYDVDGDSNYTSTRIYQACVDVTIQIHDANMNSISGTTRLQISADAGTLMGGPILFTDLVPTEIGDGMSYGPFLMDKTICDQVTSDGMVPTSGGLTVEMYWDAGDVSTIYKSGRWPGTEY